MRFTRHRWDAVGSSLLLMVACGGNASRSGSHAGGSPGHADAGNGGREMSMGGGGGAGQSSADSGGSEGGNGGHPQSGSAQGGSAGDAGDAGAGGASTEGGAPNGGAGNGSSGGSTAGSGGRATGGTSGDGTGGVLITTKYKESCTAFCKKLTSDPIFCAKFDEQSACASDCQVGLSADGEACGALGAAMTDCVKGWAGVSQYCIVGTYAGVLNCASEIDAYQDCQREHGGSPLPSPIPCPGETEHTPDGCTLTKMCDGVAPYFVTCSSDETGQHSKCTVVINGKTTNVSSPEPISAGVACEDPMVSVYALLLLK